MLRIHPGDELVTTDEAASVLRLRPQTLSNWRTTRRYNLPFVKVGGKVRYRRSDLDAFLAARRVTPSLEG